LRSPEGAWRVILAKEWRALVASRAWWVLLVATGPLVGMSFIAAVRAYAELSGMNGTAAGVGEAFSPLIGVWAPTFSACEIAAAFMLPFVAIRIVAGDRRSGALKLELQHPMSSLARMTAKAVVLLAGWTVALLPPVVAIVLWRGYGGTIYPPELLAVAMGHVLNGALTIALAASAAAVSEHPSTAAILTLTVTVGTWVLSFIAAVQGGIWERLAGYTPTSMVAEFQHGLLRLDVMLVVASLTALGLTLAAIWTRLGIAVKRRACESAAAGAFAAAVMFLSAFATASWDASENRANSFPRADEAALKQIHEPLRIEAHLAAEDPRRVDLERRALSKLRRAMPNLQVQYIAATTTGLFEQTASQYGEIWYELGGRRAMSRATTAESVLETIFALAGAVPPAEIDRDVFRGHPLAVPPRGAAAVFYGVWPALVVAGGLLTRPASNGLLTRSGSER
jgi:ABC-2 type transport system permease protein